MQKHVSNPEDPTIIIIFIITVISLSAPSSIPIILVDRSWRKVCSEENKNLVRKGAHFKYSFMSCLLWSTLLQLSSSSLLKWNYHYCSSQPSIVHWLSSPIFPCSLFVCSFVPLWWHPHFYLPPTPKPIHFLKDYDKSYSKMNREHKYNDKDEYKDNDKHKDV